MAKTNSGLLEFKDEQKVFVALDDETSEVKKAVVIDGDGVETDIIGVQPAGKKEITSTEEVNVANYATAQVVDADLIAGNIKKDVDILGVVGSYEGGTSDFSTATVTVTLTKTGGSGLGGIELKNFPYVYEDSVLFTNPGTSGTYVVPLYKGVATCEPSEIGTATISDVVVSGSAQINEGSILITGDCTITVEFTTGN